MATEFRNQQSYEEYDMPAYVNAACRIVEAHIKRDPRVSQSTELQRLVRESIHVVNEYITNLSQGKTNES